MARVGETKAFKAGKAMWVKAIQAAPASVDPSTLPLGGEAMLQLKDAIGDARFRALLGLGVTSTDERYYKARWQFANGWSDSQANSIAFYRTSSWYTPPSRK